jgi:hypothetical protein
MAATKLTYDPTTPLGEMIAECTAGAVKLKDDINRAWSVLNAITDGANAKANVEVGNAEFGAWAKVKAGQGPAIYDVMYAIKVGTDAIADSLLANTDYGNPT